MCIKERGGSSKLAESVEKKKPKLTSKYIFAFIGIVLVFVLGAALEVINSNSLNKNVDHNDNSRVIGPATAPVTIVEYGDFGCSTCRAWENQGVLAKILARYGDKVRFIWRDLPVITPQSPKAAEAADCANDQNQFWPYHDLLYSKAPALSISDLKAYAAQLGLDTPRFNACLDSSQHAVDVNNDLKDGFSHGFRATPSFLVNNMPEIGPISFDQFSQLIDAALIKASK
jgi:protein-disulfide isomerase